MLYETPRIAIVDGYATGRELARELSERGAICFHVRSTPDVPADAVFDPAPYDADLGYLGDAEHAAQTLAALRPVAVIAGAESGVDLAENLTRALRLDGNDPALAVVRRDRAAMYEAVRRSDLLVPPHAVVSEVDEAITWAWAEQRWPATVRPARLDTRDRGILCDSAEDLREAVSTVLAEQAADPARVVIQPHLDGPLFVVNTVSRGGSHYATDAWYVTLTTIDGPATTVRAMHLLDPALPSTKTLLDYMRRALDAMGIVNGAAHSQLKWTLRGPALIESTPRLMCGAMDQGAYAAAGLQTQARILAHSLVEPEQFLARLAPKRHYCAGKHMAKVFFPIPADGEVVAVDGLQRLEQLDSFHAHYRRIHIGDRVRKADSMLAPGSAVYLVHPDEATIANNIRMIRRWESRGELFGIRPLVQESATA